MTKPLIRILLVLGLACGATAAEAEEPAIDYAACRNAVQFVGDTSMQAMKLRYANFLHDPADHAALEERVKEGEVAAIKGAGEIESYRAAMKDYVLAINEFVSAARRTPADTLRVYDRRIKRAWNRLDPVKDRVYLEARLACPRQGQ